MKLAVAGIVERLDDFARPLENGTMDLQDPTGNRTATPRWTGVMPHMQDLGSLE